MDRDREYNKELIRRFPFLLPRDRMTDCVVRDFDYSFTELDDLEDGWRAAFGEQLCEEIAEALKKDGLLDTYRVVQIKEKFGALCWYDYGGNKEVRAILNRYREQSIRTCVKCGKPATRITTGWVCPYCDDCVPLRRDGKQSDSIPIERYVANLQAGRPYFAEEGGIDDDSGGTQ